MIHRDYGGWKSKVTLQKHQKCLRVSNLSNSIPESISLRSFDGFYKALMTWAEFYQLSKQKEKLKYLGYFISPLLRA